MTLQELRELYNDGTLKRLFVSGFITVKPLLLVEFHNYIEARKNLKVSDLVFDLSLAFKISERTVYRYLSYFNDNLGQ